MPEGARVIAYCGKGPHKAATLEADAVTYFEAAAARVKGGRIGVDVGHPTVTPVAEILEHAALDVRVYCKACRDVYLLPLVEAVNSSRPITLERTSQ